MEVEANIANIAILDEHVARALEEHGVDRKSKQQIKLALEEILANVASYAYPEEKGTMAVDLSISDNVVTLTISDNGLPFDPHNAKEPDIGLSAEERDIGGLGVFLVQKIMDDMVYERKNEKNVLTLTKTFTPESA